jgi:ribosomal protein S14
MSYPKAKNEKMKKRDRKCKFCGTQRGLIRKYDINICRRCFKDNAEKLGFRKYD